MSEIYGKYGEAHLFFDTRYLMNEKQQQQKWKNITATYFF